MKNKTYFVIECRLKFHGKALVKKLKAVDFTDALFQFKAKRLLNRLPYNTIVVCYEDNNAVFYDKGM